jgi:phosphomannomutase
MLKEKMACRSDRVRAVLRAVRDEYAERFPVDLRDGVKVEMPSGWFLVRGSNTEPIVRLVAEAADEAGAQALLEDVRRRVGACLGA